MSGFRSLSYDSAISPIKSIQFSTLSPRQIRRRSVVEISTTESYQGLDPVPGGSLRTHSPVKCHSMADGG